MADVGFRPMADVGKVGFSARTACDSLAQMSPVDIIFPWRKVRRRLQAALEIERYRLDAAQIGYIQDYIDHGEWDLALDQLQEALAARDLTLHASGVLQLKQSWPALGKA